MTNDTTYLGEALAYEDYLPVSCQLPDGATEPARFIGLNVLNEEILQNILALEKHHTELADDESDHTVGELAHIDFKINLLLDLMVQVFSSQLSIPPEAAISLTASRLQYGSNQAFQVGDGLFVDLFLSRRFPRPLTLYGRVASVEAQQQGGFSIVLDLDHISQPVQELLERFIFLKHRRRVASARRGQK